MSITASPRRQNRSAWPGEVNRLDPGRGLEIWILAMVIDGADFAVVFDRGDASPRLLKWLAAEPVQQYDPTTNHYPLEANDTLRVSASRYCVKGKSCVSHKKAVPWAR